MEKEIANELLPNNLNINENAETPMNLDLENIIKGLMVENTKLKKQLKEQGEYEQSKQQQLEFLTFLATVTFSKNKVETIIQSLLERCISFLETSCSYVYCHEKANITLTKGENSELNQLLQDSGNNINVAQVIENIKNAQNETLLLTGEQFFTSESLLFSKIKYVVVLPLFSLLNQFHILAIFFEDDKNLDSLKLQTLESGRQLVSIAIRRKLTEIKLDKKYTELTKANKSLKSTQKQLTQSEKMASIGQLAAGIAHEINNPVGYVMSNIESLKDYMSQFDNFFSLLIKENLEVNKTSDPDNELEFLLEDSKEIISTCVGGLTRVKAIVQDLKTFSHSGNEGFILFSLNDAVDTVLNLIASEFKYDDCEIEKNLAIILPEVFGTKNQIEQVLMNILINAKHAIDDQKGLIKIETFANSEYVFLHISDNGCGMDEKTKQRLFDPFFTTKSVGVGTGLGLSISYKIIEAHRGYVEVESEIGKGTCFKISLPLPENLA
ncbi:His Kinase A (phospho-acceptor) domain-containing protein [Pseudoalteromonas denitrificans DSM 6059]|uniref:histidine kinase n=2 Tax=Pseudoalteromonas TaxID=53246 RepID=A0A1I1JTN5_9GAMM|nr:His Kinase A (phospho-acceptor) domain-containing protein [Pseudoalteromonas denitrificans DSM 6059]